jgi:hydroxymethylpyrimidine/phosphomethylpyrimidine kinase
MSGSASTIKPPVVLTIAGSDNSCGAGAQADLKTITALGGYGQTAVTCLVAEVPGRVEAIQVARPGLVSQQVRLSFDAFPVKAVKTGMLFSTAIISAVVDVLSEIARGVPLVVDPVMVASSGDSLLKPGAITAYRKRLFPLATLVTPNLDELRILSGMACRDLDGMRKAGTMLVETYGCAFLLKGGHLKSRLATDLLVTQNGIEDFSAPFCQGIDAHGTGCTYSAAIATELAKGKGLSEAVGIAKRYITAAIQGSLRWGSTTALDHRVSL